MSKRHYEPYTEAEILRAIELKGGRERTWPEVGRLMGRCPDSLRQRVYQYRTGKTDFPRAESEAVIQSVVEDVITLGISVNEAARRRGRRPSAVGNLIRNRGWDRETIAEEKSLRGYA